MKNLFVFFTFLFLGNFCQAQVQFDSLSFDKAIELANKQQKFVFLDFRADWCKPCIEMEQTTFKDTVLGNYLKKHAVSLKIDVDQFSGMDVKEKYNVNQYPTMLLIDPYDQAVQLRMIGFKTAPILLKDLEFVLGDIVTDSEPDQPVVVDKEITKEKKKKKCSIGQWLDRITD